MKVLSNTDDKFRLESMPEAGCKADLGARLRPIRHNVSCLWLLDWINGSITLQF